MRPELRVLDGVGEVVAAGAALIVEAAAAAIAAHGRCAMAVSGGATPRAMFATLAAAPLDWERVTFFQVDERVAPDGDDDRNLTHLLAALGAAPARVEAMPVGAADLDAAAARYAASLPEHLDLVHLGIGPDGHTASLVPGDPALEVTDRLVATTAPYQGRRRMTLTYPAIAHATRVLWVIAGSDKRDALARMLEGDPTIPAGRVVAANAVVLCDRAAT